MKTLAALDIARSVRADALPDRLGRLAAFIRDTLGIEPQCGVSAYEIARVFTAPNLQTSTHTIVVGDTNCLRQGRQLTSDEARGMARLLLIAADDLDTANGRAR